MIAIEFSTQDYREVSLEIESRKLKSSLKDHAKSESSRIVSSQSRSCKEVSNERDVPDEPTAVVRKFLILSVPSIDVQCFSIEIL